MDPTPAPTFAGFVLAGGSSRRMGRDKALIEVRGRPLVVHACAALSVAGASSVAVVGGDARSFAALGLDTVADGHPGAGPLGAIVTALGTVAEHVSAMILSCDLADPAPANITALVSQLGPGVDVVVASAQGARQWLHAAWSPAARVELERRFRAGERSIHGAVGTLVVKEVGVPEPDRLGDVDTPRDLSSVLRERGDRR